MTSLNNARTALILCMLALGCSTMRPADVRPSAAKESPAMEAAPGEAQAAASPGLNVGHADVATTAGQARDPKADQMIQELSRRGRARLAFRFRFVDEFDEVQPDGRRIQLTHLRQGVVRRPDRIAIETTGDVANRTILKDGRTVTLWDRDENIYAQIPDPGTIDQALDTLMERYRTAVPAADLFYEDPGRSLLEQSTGSRYVGPSLVDDQPCHHLVFTGPDYDWQVWISETEPPNLRKLVIDYKSLAGRPQYALRVLGVETLDAVDEKAFQFIPPAGAEKAEMQPAVRKSKP